MYWHLSVVLTVSIGYIYAIMIGGILIPWAVYLLVVNVRIAEYINSKESPKIFSAVVDEPKKKKVEFSLSEFFDEEWQVGILGAIERFLYLTSILVGKPEFIAVWLTLKTVYTSWARKKTEYRGYYNNFIIGNGLSIIFSVSGAGIALGVKGIPGFFQNLLLPCNYPLYSWFLVISPIILFGLIILILYLMHNKLIGEMRELPKQYGQETDLASG